MQKNLKTDLGSIAYSIYGDGKTIVFLHGFLGNRTVWDAFVDHFKADYKVITIDLPGHGETSVIEDEMTMDFSAQLVDIVLQKESIPNSHIVGHSMGGYIGLAYSKLFPLKMNSLTLFNSTATKDDEQKQSDRLKAVRVFDMNPSIFIDEAIKNLFYEPNLELFPEHAKELTKMAKKTPIKGAQGSLRGMRLMLGTWALLKIKKLVLRQLKSLFFDKPLCLSTPNKGINQNKLLFNN